MVKISTVFKERVERGMRFREYFYISIVIIYLIYQFSILSGKPSSTEVVLYYFAVGIFMLIDRIILSYIKKGIGTDLFTIISVGKDIFLLSFLIHLTGGIESPFIFTYVLLPLGIGAAMGFLYGIIVLSVTVISFLALLYLEYYGFLEHHTQGYFTKMSPVYKNLWIILMVCLQILVLGFLMVFSNRYIARRLRLREKELAVTVDELNKINKQMELSNAELINLTSQIELQREMLERTTRLQKTLYNITTHLVEQYSVDMLIKKIHNEISNIMPVLYCGILTKKKEEENYEFISSSKEMIVTPKIIECFTHAIESRDVFLKEEILVVPVKVESNHSAGIVCKKDPLARQLRDEEIKLIMTLAQQLNVYLDRLELYQKLHHLSNTDGLTGLYNHRFFHIRLEEELSRCRRIQKPLSLLIMDMDNFKDVNDKYGHQEGDRILSVIAGVLREGVRSSDVLARYGGDEFSAILPETDSKTAENIAHRILEKIKGTDIPVQNDKIRLSLSIGISTMLPDEIVPSRELINRADTALYEAKRRGSGSIKIS